MGEETVKTFDHVGTAILPLAGSLMPVRRRGARREWIVQIQSPTRFMFVLSRRSLHSVFIARTECNRLKFKKLSYAGASDFQFDRPFLAFGAAGPLVHSAGSDLSAWQQASYRGMIPWHWAEVWEA
jgi:hypothetical protein